MKVNFYLLACILSSTNSRKGDRGVYTEGAAETHPKHHNSMDFHTNRHFQKNMDYFLSSESLVAVLTIPAEELYLYLRSFKMKYSVLYMHLISCACVSSSVPVFYAFFSSFMHFTEQFMVLSPSDGDDGFL